MTIEYVNLNISYLPGGLSLEATKRTAKAIDSLVAPRPISPLIGRPSNCTQFKYYLDHMDNKKLPVMFVISSNSCKEILSGFWKKDKPAISWSKIDEVP